MGQILFKSIVSTSANTLYEKYSVGLASGRATSLQKLSDEVLAWLSVWSEVQMICIWSR